MGMESIRTDRQNLPCSKFTEEEWASIRQTLAFVDAVPDIPQEARGKKYTSTCICGGTITAVRSIYNGHLHAKCAKCGMAIME